MKKVLLLISLILLFTGCSAPKSDKLVIGFTDYPPMGFKDDKGNIVGFDIDFATAVAEEMERDVEFQYINWDSKVLELNSKQIDLIWNGFTVTPERQKEVLFSKPYVINSIVIITRADDDSIKSFEDLKNKYVAVESESSGQHLLESEFDINSELTLNRFTSISEALLDLKAGNSDAVVADEIYGRYIISKDNNVKVIDGVQMNAEDYAVGMRLNDTELQTELNKAIDAVVDKGIASDISIKWFGEDIIKR